MEAQLNPKIPSERTEIGNLKVLNSSRRGLQSTC